MPISRKPPPPRRSPEGWSTRVMVMRRPRTWRLADGDARDAGAELGPDAVDVHLALHAAPVAQRQQVDVGDVARAVEPDLEPALGREGVAVGRPARRAVAVEGGERDVLGELEQAAAGRGAQVARALNDRDRLRVGPEVRERVDARVVGVERLVLRQRAAEVLLAPLGQEAPAAVGVGHDDLGAARRLAAQFGRREVARVEQRPALGERAERGQRADAVGAAVDHRGRRIGFDVDDAAPGRQVVAAHLRLDDGAAEVAPRRAAARAAGRSCGRAGPGPGRSAPPRPPRGPRRRCGGCRRRCP